MTIVTIAAAAAIVVPDNKPMRKIPHNVARAQMSICTTGAVEHCYVACSTGHALHTDITKGME